MIDIEIGPARGDEMAFVLNSMKESLGASLQEEMADRLAELLPVIGESPDLAARNIVRATEGRLYWHGNRLCDDLLATDPLILVARAKDDPAFAYGWLALGSVAGVTALYYVFVKKHYRRYGVMSQLMVRALDLAPDNGEHVYCVRSARDKVFEAFGLEYRPLRDVLQQQRKTA